MDPQVRSFARHAGTRHALLAAALLATSLIPRVASSHTIIGHIVADNEVTVFTAASETPSMTINYSGIWTCWPTAVPVNITTADRFLYLVCYSDLSVAQGLLHDLQIDGNPVLSGDPAWGVLPTDSSIVYSGCVAPPATAIEAAMASRIPTGVFVAPAVGCQNLAAGCYGTWGHVSLISSQSDWTWFDSGRQVSTNAPFQPGFNHREFLIFRLDMGILTGVKQTSWGQLRTIYR